MTTSNTILIDAGVAGHSRAFLVKGQKTVIVDTGMPGNAQNILKALERSDIGVSDVSLILITHSHIDHFGSARELKELLQVPLAIGKTDAKYLAHGKNAPIVPRSPEGHAQLRMIQSQGRADGDLTLSVQPDILIDGDTDLSKYGVAAEALHTPGHTSGSLSIAVQDGDCAIGDLLASMSPSSSLGFSAFAEDPDEMVPSLKKVLGHDPVWLYPAHGNRIEAAEARKNFADLL
ncbi:MAG TPA: MBL fold metallo-hydrolase [Methanocella sp.]|nr:MBL fold metallo-hydrolase [Methanocella sp.]